MSDELSPHTFEEAAAVLAAAAAEGRAVRIVGGGTKLGWGESDKAPDLELHTAALDRTLEYNAGDLTAVVQAGVPLARLQQELAAEGQMLALDPPLGAEEDSGATIGGVFATGDCGPIRHRYGAPRDLVLGITVALSDGTIARAGSKVIKNVAGYDLAKLFTGSFGTLGLILSVSVRLHPLPVHTATALGVSADPDTLAGAARALSAAPLELEALDVAWRGGLGGILARCAGVEVARRAARIATQMREAGLEQVDVALDDDEVWARQRAGQRSLRATVRVVARPRELAAVIRATESSGGALVGRAAFGSCYVEVDPAAVPMLRQRLPPNTISVVQDFAGGQREHPDRFSPVPGTALELMRRIKLRFDPAQACNPGVFVGGI